MSPKSYRRIFASHSPPGRSGFSKGNLGLYVIVVIIGTSVCDKYHTHSHYHFAGNGVGAMRKSRGIIDLRVVGPSPLSNY